MRRFFLVFFITLVIASFSIILSLVTGALLFFGKYALFPSPESVPYFVPRLISRVVELFPCFLFIRWQVRKHSQRPAWIVWLGGLLAIGIAQALFWGPMKYRIFH